MQQRKEKGARSLFIGQQCCHSSTMFLFHPPTRSFKKADKTKTAGTFFLPLQRVTTAPNSQNCTKHLSEGKATSIYILLRSQSRAVYLPAKLPTTHGAVQPSISGAGSPHYSVQVSVPHRQLKTAHSISVLCRRQIVGQTRYYGGT